MWIETALASTQGAGSEAAKDGVVAVLGLDWKLFIAQFINFALVMLIMWKLVFKGLLKTMNERQDKIKQSLADAVRIKDELAAAEETKKDIIKKAHAEAAEIIENTTKRADKLAEERMLKSEKDVEKMVTSAKAELLTEKRKMVEEMKKDMATIIISAAEKITKNAITPTVDEKLVEDAIKEIDKSK